jgi:hypothetical protein
VTTFASTLNSPAEQRHIERLIVETFDATPTEPGRELPPELRGATAAFRSAGERKSTFPSGTFPGSVGVVQKLWEDK